MSENVLSAVVVIASAGRPDLLAEVTADISSRATVDFEAVVSVPDEKSLPEGGGLPGWTTVTGARGLAAQRNAAIDRLGDTDVVFFFDDDAVVRGDYIERGLAFFAAHPEIVGITGRVLIDGASSGEVSREAAREALGKSEAMPTTDGWTASRTLYGCNFAFRLSAVPDIRFDARLPLYSWLEDHDFARRLMKRGLLAKVDDCVIVHRAASSGGRQAHTRLGYSQMMNPLYLWRTGSFPLWLAVWEIFRPTAKNVAKSVAGPESPWRRERLRGNRLAARDALRGEFNPENMLDL